MNFSPNSYGADKVLSICPKCKQRTLHVQGLRGRDDYGQIEGEQEECENKDCDYRDQWAARC